MRLLLCICCCALLGTVPAFPAINAYLMLSSNGEVVETDPVHSWVSILGFEQGVANSTDIGTIDPGGKSTGKPVTLSIGQDRSIARMMRGIAVGESFDLTLHLARPGEKDDIVLLALEFVGVLFSSICVSGESGAEFVKFDVTFSYRKLIYSQSILSNDGLRVEGTLEATADFVAARFSGPAVGTAIPVGDYAGGTTPPSGTDNDGDGIPNTWEETYNFDPENGADAGLDTDRDGFTNIEEYIAGTHPRLSGSFFQVRSVREEAALGTMQLRWDGVAGRTYHVLASANPDSGFTTAYTVIASANGLLAFEPPANVGPFFRIRVVK